MEALAFWTIYPSADRDEVADLVLRLADELDIPTPPILEDSVALPPGSQRVTAALDKVEPDWRSRALLLPP
jgi:hypothetical protein